MTKGVVPHPKSYRKVGIEDWLDGVEIIAPGFIGSWFKAYVESEDKKKACRKWGELSAQAAASYHAAMEATFDEMIDSNLFPDSPDDLLMIALWLETKQVYRINRYLTEEMSLDESSSIPIEVLDRMPYPALYIQDKSERTVPWIVMKEDDGNGRYEFVDANVTLQSDGAFIWKDEDELRMAFFSKRRTVMPGRGAVKDFGSHFDLITAEFDLHGVKTFGDLIEQYREELEPENDKTTGMLADMVENGEIPEDTLEDAGYQRMLEICSSDALYDISRYLGTLLYICSTNADMEPMYAPSPIRTGKQAKRNDTEATVTAVGYREGRALEQARAAHERELKERETVDLPHGTHRSPVPHWRRGYFGYRWCGSGEERHPELRWVSPAAVNFDKDSKNETVTFHAVEPEVC